MADFDVVPLGSCPSVVTTTALTTTTEAPFFTDCNWPDDDSMVSWKGTKNAKIIYSGESSAFIRVSVFNNDPNVDTYNNDYIGFLGFSKKYCGMDVLRGFDEGRLTVSFVDNGNFYTRYGVDANGDTKKWPGYLRAEGRHSSYTIQASLNFFFHFEKKLKFFHFCVIFMYYI